MIREFLIQNGAADVGFAMAEYGDLKYAVSICVKLSNFVFSQLDKEPTYTYFNHYKTANALIDRLILLAGNEIEKTGYLYFPVPASQTVNGHDSYRGEYSHKKAAVLAGLGSVGKNGLFLHKRYGARVRLGTIFTNMPLDISDFKYEDLCGDCNACVQSCPAQALYGRSFSISDNDADLVDRKACSDYMKKHFMHIGRGSVCGICISKCAFLD